MSALKLNGFEKSGHSHRAKLMLELLGIDYDYHQVDLANGEHKSPEYLAKNPFGQVPMLEDGDTVISDSNAILVYLVSKFAPDSQWLPNDPAKLAEVQRFLSLAAGPIAFGPARARLVNVFGAKVDHQTAIDTAHDALAIYEEVLKDRAFLTGSQVTIADVANYAYIKHAPEGDVDLSGYPNVLEWLARVEALPGFTPMPETNVGLVA